MQIVRTVPALRAALAGWRGDRIALVPTMGALHAGHMALIAEARRRADHVVASVFVNPKQFGPSEDLARYPRREAHDARMLEENGAGLLFAPTAEAMYPTGFATTVAVGGISEGLEGQARPGHFDGVATVVLKLFNQVQPDVALFGEKDFQQLAVIRRMVADLDLPIEIVCVPTQREDDGVALSSRNVYLSPEDRIAARTLPRALGEAAERIGEGMPTHEALGKAHERLSSAGFAPIDYVALVDAETLAPVDAVTRSARLLAAARIGGTRLIDTLAVEPS